MNVETLAQIVEEYRKSIVETFQAQQRLNKNVNDRLINANKVIEASLDMLADYSKEVEKAIAILSERISMLERQMQVNDTEQ